MVYLLTGEKKIKKYEEVTRGKQGDTARERERERKRKALRKKLMGKWTERLPQDYAGISVDALFKNRIVSATSRWQVVIGWKKL